MEPISKKKYVSFVSLLLRFFLRNWPITEGKKQLVRLLGKFSVPTGEVLVKMKDGFEMQLNMDNKEHVHIFYMVSMMKEW